MAAALLVPHRRLGVYTDDTQMTLALTTSLVEAGRCDVAAAAAAYADHFQTWRGYGDNTARVSPLTCHACIIECARTAAFNASCLPHVWRKAPVGAQTAAGAAIRRVALCLECVCIVPGHLLVCVCILLPGYLL